MLRQRGGFFVILAALAFVGCATTGPSDQEKAELHLSIGTSHLNKGNYPSALSELLTAESLDDDNPVIQNNLGLAYFVRGKFTLAEKHLRRAIEIEPKYTEARNNLGRVLIDQGLYDLAIRELKVAVEDLTYATPDKSHSNLGLAYFYRGDYALALEQLKKSLGYNKSNCTAYHFYGRTLFELNQLETASRAFDQAVKICENRKFDEPLYYSALSYYRLGQREQAVARFEEMLSRYPDSTNSEKARDLLKLMK